MNQSECAINIGARERRKRAVFGLVFLALSVVLGGILIALGVQWYWRIGLVFPLWMSMLGFFQAREKT